MSKVFEALQRLERESGRSLPGVSTQAREVLQNGAAQHNDLSRELIVPPPEEIEIAEPQAQPVAPPVGPGSNNIEAAFKLSQIPIENATITPASRIVYYTDPDSAGADRFRLLRMRLGPLWEAGKLKALLVTSPQ